MTKDEAIKRIIEMVNYHDGGHIQPYVADKLVDFLTDELGMLPPFNKNHGYDNFSLAMGVGNKYLYF